MTRWRSAPQRLRPRRRSGSDAHAEEVGRERTRVPDLHAVHRAGEEARQREAVPCEHDVPALRRDQTT